MRASSQAGCARAGAVKVNQWLTLRATVACGTLRQDERLLVAGLQHEFRGEQGTPPAVQACPGRLFFCAFAGRALQRGMVQPHDEPAPAAPREAPASPQRGERAPREPMFNIPAVVVGLIALCVAIHLLRLYVLSVDQDIELLVRAAFIPVRYSGEYSLDVYAFTSPVTYSLLHGSIPHLVVNAIWLAAFGAPLAVRLGAWRFLLFWVATAVAAAALHYVLHSGDHAPLVGASGAISGMMGAAARFGFRIDRRPGGSGFGGPILPVAQVLRMRGVLTFLAVWMCVNLVTGLAGFMPGSESQIAWEAHIGGFLAGFLGIRSFDRR